MKIEFTLLEIVLFLSLVGMIVWMIIQKMYWLYKKIDYTRERFTFFSLQTIASLIILFTPTIFGSNAWFKLISFLSIEFFNKPLNLGNPDFSDRFLALIIITGVIAVVIYFHRNWSGQKSVLQTEQEKRKEQASIIKDVYAIIKRDKNLRPFNSALDETVFFEINAHKFNQLPWHIQVAELLVLASNQYKIKPSEDWYEEEKVFIGKYGKQNITLGVLCITKGLDEDKIIKFLSFIENEVGKTNYKLVIATKDLFDQETVSLKYKGKVDFIDEETMLSNLINFNDYFNYIIEGFEKKSVIEGYNYSLQDIYTEPSCTIKTYSHQNSNKNAIVKSAEQHILNWVHADIQNKHLAILGEYGQGKSVLSHKIAYELVKKRNNDFKIPIIIELRGKFPKQYSSPLALLSDWCSYFGINPKSLLKLHFAGKLLLIFEGFDEMELVGDYEIRLDHFRKIWEFSSSNSKIIITGRPNFFLNNQELQALLRTNQANSHLPYCEEIHLNKFTINQIERALRSAETDIRNDIMSIVNAQKDGGSFLDLISRPSSLFLTSIVWKDRNLRQYKENINSATVIEEFLNHSYSRQVLKEVKTPLSIFERAYFMLGIAIAMIHKNGYTNQISQMELYEIAQKLYNNFPDEITKRQVIDSAYGTKLDQRFDLKYNLESVFLDIRSCGILVRDLSTFDSFKFAHKSFLELLASKFLVPKILKDDNESIDTISMNAISIAIETPLLSYFYKSPDVTKFIAELLSKKIIIPHGFNEFETIKYILKILHPMKRGSFYFLMFTVNIFGRTISPSILTCLVFGILSFIMYLWSLFFPGILTLLSIPGKVAYFKQNFFLIISLYFICVLSLIKLSMKFLLQSSTSESLVNMILEIDKKNSLPSFSLPKPVGIFQYRLKIVDSNNFLLWFMVCAELNLLEYLKKMINPIFYRELEFCAALINKDFDKLKQYFIHPKEKEGITAD